MPAPEYPIKRRCDVKPSEEWRTGPVDPWLAHDQDALIANEHRWVEARPKRLPNPKWMSTGYGGPASTEMVAHEPTHWGVTTVGEMRDRPDLDQWEGACFSDDGWTSAARIFEVFGRAWPDDFPVIVRRRP